MPTEKLSAEINSVQVMIQKRNQHLQESVGNPENRNEKNSKFNNLKNVDHILIFLKFVQRKIVNKNIKSD